MSRVKRDENREERITMEAVVDAYNEDERAMGWYYYLDDRIHFPFQAKWVSRQRPQGRDVEVIEMSPEEECSHDMFVEVRYQEGGVDDIFSARLSDIKPIDIDEETAEAIAQQFSFWKEKNTNFFTLIEK